MKERETERQSGGYEAAVEREALRRLSGSSRGPSGGNEAALGKGSPDEALRKPVVLRRRSGGSRETILMFSRPDPKRQVSR